MGVKLGPMEYLFLKKYKVRNIYLHNYSHPQYYQTDACWDGGGHCSLHFCSTYVVRNNGMDIYLPFLIFG